MVIIIFTLQIYDIIRLIIFSQVCMMCDHFRQSAEWTFALDNLNLGWVLLKLLYPVIPCYILSYLVISSYNLVLGWVLISFHNLSYQLSPIKAWKTLYKTFCCSSCVLWSWGRCLKTTVIFFPILYSAGAVFDINFAACISILFSAFFGPKKSWV